MPVRMSGIKSIEEYNTLIDADEMDAAGVASVELVEVKPNYHARIMNIPSPKVMSADYEVHNSYPREAMELAYKNGHRDARHLAAEIANEADARIVELEAENGKLCSQVDDAVAELVKANALYSECLNGNRVLRQRAQEAEDQGVKEAEAAYSRMEKAEADAARLTRELDLAKRGNQRQWYENARLRAALEEYADTANWYVDRESGPAHFGWLGGDPTAIAQLALSPESAAPAEQRNPLCVCNHRLDTHNPCCVSACGCDQFVAADKSLTDAYVDALMAATAPTARPPHTHYCQEHADRWTCSDTTCERGEVFGCPLTESTALAEEVKRNG